MRLTVLIAVALGAGGCAGEVYTAGYGYSTYPYYDGYYAPTASVVVSPYYRSYPRYSVPYRTYYRGHPGYYRGHGQRGHYHGGHHHHRR